MLHVFGRFFFPRLIESDDCPEFHMELLRHLTSPDSEAIIEPRGFSKTTWEKIDTLHDVVYALEPIVMFIGATQGDVTFHFDGVKGELESNEHLRRCYGSLVPRVGAPGTKWNSKHIRTTNGVNLVGRGAGKGRGVNIDGKRPTKIVGDDCETDEMVRSVVRREKFWRWLMEVIMPSLDPKRGRLKLIGTVLHPKAAVLRFHDERGGVKRAAIENGKSIWPERFPIRDLHRIRDGYTRPDGKRVLGIGTRAFSQELLNMPIGEGLTMFKQEWLDTNTWNSATLPPLVELDVYMALDPAAGESSVADYYGATVIGRHKLTGIRYVLASSMYQGSIGSAVRMPDGKTLRTGARKWFHQIYSRWQPVACGVEAARTVQAFYQILRDCGEYRIVKLLPSMGIGGGMAPKEERAKLVVPHVETGMVKFHPAQTDLYDQMTVFPSADVNDDIFDSFMHCNSMLDTDSDTLVIEKTANVGTANIKTKDF